MTVWIHLFWILSRANCDSRSSAGKAAVLGIPTQLKQRNGKTKLQLCMNYYQHFFYSKTSGWKGPKKERAERLCRCWWFLRILLSPAPCGNVLRLIKWSDDGISNLSSPDTFDVWICHEVLPCVKGQAGLRYHGACVLLHGQPGRQKT